MVATLNIAGDSAGMKNRWSEFSMPITAAAIATNVRNGSMIRVSRTVSSSFPGTARYSPANALDQRLGEDDAEHHEDAGDDDERVDDVVAQPPGGLLAVGRQLPRERRHERGAHRAFGEQIAHEVGNAERDVVGVHRVARAEERRQHLFADDAEDAARHRRGAGRRGRARDGR